MNVIKQGVLNCGCNWQRIGDADVIVGVRRGCRLHDTQPAPIPERTPFQLWWATWGVWVILAAAVLCVFMVAAGVGNTLAWVGTIVILAFGVLFCWWIVEAVRGRV